MNNFHYRGPGNYPKNEKSSKLLEQLQMIDRELEEDNRKLAEKKKLEEEFYEDNNRMNLADQIMNELLNKKPQPNQYAINQPKSIQNSYSPPKFLPQPQQQPLQKRPNPRPQPQAPQYINPRQLQKIKLQNNNAQQEFPFGGNSRQKDRKVKIQYQNPTRLSPDREPPAKNNYVGGKAKEVEKIQNPFLKNDQQLRERRQKDQKEYRRLLEQQMQQQKRKKQQQKQKYKQQIKQKFNSYVPVGTTPNSNPHENESKPPQNVYKKKRDPNAQYNSLQKPTTEIRSSDIEYMKLQVQDLKTRFKKGRINFEDYQQQIKKLENHYKIQVEELGDDENQGKKVENREVDKPVYNNLSGNNSDRIKNSIASPSYETAQKRQTEVLTNKSRNMPAQSYQPQPNYEAFNNISVPLQQMRPPQPYPNYSNYYPQQPVAMPAPQSDFQMQMMFKILDEFKSLFKMQAETIINDKKVLQDTLTKMIPTANPIMHTQQVPSNQLPQPPKQFFTQAKKSEKHESTPKMPHQHHHHQHHQPIDISMPQSSQSQISSSYIQKSMSGIVNKVPLTKHQKQQDKIDSNKDLIKFYDRKYKVRKFQGFQYKEVENQSNNVIPSVSNFVQTKNSYNQLNQAFEIDLRNYKKLQKEKEMQLMMERIKKTKQVETRVSPKKSKFEENVSRQLKNIYYPDPVPEQKLKKEEQVMVNPFLKKHISNQSRHEAQAQPEPQPQPVKNKFDIHNFSSPATKYQILQQQQYQTQPKKNQSPTPPASNPTKPQPPATQSSNSNPNPQKSYPSSKILNTVKANNEILAKYEMTPPSHTHLHPNMQNSQANIGSNSLSSIKEMIKQDSSKELSSREYFSGYEISPVQKREYQSSLETVRSQEESAKFQRRNNMDILVMKSVGRSSNFQSNFRSPNTESSHSIQNSPTIQSIQIQKKPAQSPNPTQPRLQHPQLHQYPNIGYSQTVQSIQQSESKLPTFQRPPNNSRKTNGRSVSRKKQSIIKLGNSDHFQKSGLSGIVSQGSKEKSSENRNLSEYENVSKMEAPKFDSAVYESGYEQSMNLNPVGRNQRKEGVLEQSRSEVPSTFKQVLTQQNRFSSKYDKIINEVSPSNVKEFHQQQQYPGPTQKQNPTSIQIPKLKSLDEARKIAREFKQRSSQDHNKSSVQQKLSSLQSLQVSKKQQSMYRPSRREQTTTNKKKDIMKILDDLGEEEYEPDFDSYREESER